jgi:glyoxylase-like metal-dependent hydrolase (beta-lactamase superfamily II)
MKRAVKWFIWIIVFIIIAGTVLLLYSPVPAKTSFNVTLEELRTLADQDKGKLPVSINALNITDGKFPAGIVVAGYFSPMSVPCYVWQINYSGANAQRIMVDTAQHKKHLKGISAGGIFHEKEYNLMQNALRSASKIVLTHEHLDHAGGAALSPYLNEILPKLWITPEQKNGSFMADALFPDGALDKAQILSYDRVMKFAPGVVLIKTPGHTEGSQILYVKLSNGMEYILAGDIAWSMMNINIPKGRPLLTSLALKENRTNSANQLRWLNDMQKEGLTILITHDGGHVSDAAAKGLIKIGLE